MVLRAARRSTIRDCSISPLRCWRTLRDKTDEGGHAGERGEASTARARWMAFTGVVEGTFFSAVILLGYLPPLTLEVCGTTP